MGALEKRGEPESGRRGEAEKGRSGEAEKGRESARRRTSSAKGQPAPASRRAS